MSTNYKDLLNERLKDADFKKEYEELNPEYEVIKAVLAARKSIDMTQKELAEVSGVAQSDISKLENGNSNPTIKMLQRLASGMNMHLKVEFVPNNLS
ncbi:MAG: helix-turn-helix transcriptional regulator [Ruminococcaceae bacterium]|nr:helix-turn-helix transcriptional regulator [Oscillospiraceae bacterium]